MNKLRYLPFARYLEDYPLPQWVIAQAKAQQAYGQLLDRVRWRSLGTKIYGQHNRPGLSGTGGQPFQSVSSQMFQSMPSSRHPSQSMPSPRNMMPPHVQSVPHVRTPTLPSNGVVPSTSGRPNGMAPPPSAVLRSQPDAQPIPSGTNGATINRSPAIPESSKFRSPSTSAPQSYQSYTAHAHTAPPTASDSKG